MAEGDSFLPRIQSVFYAAFDVREGSKLIYQVPEGLIAVPAGPVAEGPAGQPHLLSSSNSPRKRSVSANRTLFNFDDISKYVIPPSPLCGRLVICPTRNHRIIGFPVELRGKYERNYFRYNICFVFNRSADLSCYEPVVRKVSRVMTACEEESAFLSNPQTSTAILPILEQLYEDLNSYSETAIPIDRFNSIQLKILPFYPNPPPVHDWQVPLSLINLTNRIEPNWDLTVTKICQFVDGVTHVSRIAYLADCDLELTRQAIAHLLHYQVLMMIDIFQYSNMYTLRKSIQWLADERHVMEECGPYVTKPGWSIPDWPKLLHLYSRLKPGKTILEWMQEFEVHTLGIDVRRFTSFGVIKGFLRRVHRWPILLPSTDSSSQSLDRHISESSTAKRRKSMSAALPSIQDDGSNENSRTFILRGRQPESLRTSEASASLPISAIQMKRKTSAAESALEILKTRHAKDSDPLMESTKTDISASKSIQSRLTQERHSRVFSETTPQFHQPQNPQKTLSTISQGLPISLNSQLPQVPFDDSPRHGVLEIKTRHRLTKSPSAPAIKLNMATTLTTAVNTIPPQPHSLNLMHPPELAAMLNGEHHTDQLATLFEAGWALLERWLVSIGGGRGDGDFGRVAIIYR